MGKGLGLLRYERAGLNFLALYAGVFYRCRVYLFSRSFVLLGLLAVLFSSL
jgi:hypothetical protein